MSKEMSPKTREVIGQIKVVLLANNCAIQKDENEFFRSISWHTFQAQIQYDIFKNNVESFRFAEHRDTIQKISDYGKSIRSSFDGMSHFQTDLLKRQLGKIEPVEGFENQESLERFKKDILQLTQAMDAIIDIMGEFSPGAPVRKHLIKKIKFDFLQLVASVCINSIDKAPSADRNGYFCELAGYLLEQVTGEVVLDSYRIVNDVFSMTHLPDPKFG